MTWMTRAAVFGLMSLATAAQAAETVRFVACPIYRDVPEAGAKMGCWLADDRTSGVRYDVGKGLTHPDWNHEILVEGVVSTTEKDVCGGVVLTPISVSRLPGECVRKIMPAENFTGRKFVYTDTNLAPIFVKRPVPADLDKGRVFDLTFDFNEDFLLYAFDDYWLDQAAAYIKQAHTTKVEVVGYAAAAPVTASGRSLAEDPRVARRRAEIITDSLIRLGISPKLIVTRWDVAPAARGDVADGLPEASKRRVEIRISAGPVKPASR